LRAVVATRLGGPEVLELRDVPEPQAGPDQILIRVRRAGVNFADLSSTRGTYAQAPPPPFIPGLEVSGKELAGDRPVIGLVAMGGYAELVAADPRFVWDAEGMDLELAGGYPLVALTAFHALAEVARMRRGETVLVTAAAGGVGSTSIQMARALGAGRVIGMAGSEEKRRFAIDQGADLAIAYDDPVPEPVDVVVEMVGQPVFERLLDAVRPLGRFVLIGWSGGEIQEIPGVLDLRARGVGVFPFSLGAYRSKNPDAFARTAAPGLELLRKGLVKPPVGLVLPLEQAAEAHRLVGSRETMGKVLLAV